MTFIRRPIVMKASTARLTSWGICPADNWTRIRAFPEQHKISSSQPQNKCFSLTADIYFGPLIRCKMSDKLEKVSWISIGKLTLHNSTVKPRYFITTGTFTGTVCGDVGGSTGKQRWDLTPMPLDLCQCIYFNWPNNNDSESTSSRPFVYLFEGQFGGT